MSSISIYSKFENLPTDLKQEVSDFIDFLVTKSTNKEKKKQPKFGSAKGKIKMASDFDAPLEDFKDYM